MDGREEPVRLIGINTPESVDPRRPVECLGKEASAKTAELLRGVQTVEVEPDPETYERVLAEQLAQGHDRRVAEGQAKRAGILAARKKAGEG